MELILIRHGQSESNARLTTALDASLTELGQRQADATARHLESRLVHTNETLHILVSPFRRTLQTCAPLIRLLSQDPIIYPLMCEYFCSDIAAYASFQGLSHSDIKNQFPELCNSSGIHHEWWPRSLEDISDIYSRMSQVKDELWQRYGATDAQVVIFSHAEPIGRLIEVLEQREPNPGWPPWTENCGINRLTVNSFDEPAQVSVLNDTSHLSVLGLISPTYQ